MNGYKASYNGKCLDQLYEVGEVYELNEKLKIGDGFLIMEKFIKNFLIYFGIEMLYEFNF